MKPYADGDTQTQCANCAHWREAVEGLGRVCKELRAERDALVAFRDERIRTLEHQLAYCKRDAKRDVSISVAKRLRSLANYFDWPA